MPKQKITGRTAVIAGNGRLPVDVAHALVVQGEKPFLLPLRGEAEISLYDFDHQEISVVEFAKLIHALRAEDIQNVVLAGGVTKRPLLRDLRFDMPTLKALPRLFFALGQGDDALLRAFIRLLESYGFRVIGAHELVGQLLAPFHARLTRVKARAALRRDIALGKQAAQLLGQLDVGQGVVVAGGRVVAIEGAEGTDAMLERVACLRHERRISPKGGVLVKMMKPGQEQRADLPTIGPTTMDKVAAARLDGVAVEAGHSFILDWNETIARADRYQIFIETI